MEKENLYFNDTSPSHVQVDPLPNSFFNLNWENSMDQNSPFESALSSIVSSPVASNAAAPADIGELIGRLGSICNSPIMCGNNSTNTSCYTSPLNSPPKLNLSTRANLPNLGNSNLTQPNSTSFSTDPGFAERAARFSCFGQFGFNETQFPYHQFTPRMENGKLSRVSSSQTLKAFGSQIVDDEEKESALQNGLEMDMRSAYALSSASNRKFDLSSKSSGRKNEEFTNALEASLGSKQISGEDAGFKGPNDTHCRKRKAVTRGKAAKDLTSSSSANDAKAAEENDNSNSKRSKQAEAIRNENVELSGTSINTAENGDQKQTKSNPKTPEPPKDYIHVRARRGQATDSHSLAERVRREKISERMKLLQDLVPGCNKVTGKAVMLDEIINYVQSLQRQVEFLSMKLSNVNPRLDFNMDTKDILQSRESLPYTIYPLDSSVSAYNQQARRESSLPNNLSNGVGTQFFVNPNLNMQLPPLDGIGEASASSQLAALWEDDLQSFVQMGFNQNQLGNGISMAEFQS